MRSSFSKYLLTLGLLTTSTQACYGPSQYGTLLFSCIENTTHVTFNNPPINLMNTPLINDLHSFLLSLQPTGPLTSPSTPSTPKIVIFSSSNPDFFLSHLDLNFLLPPGTPAKTEATNKYTEITHLLQNITSTAFIAKINGRAFGAGQEMILQMDMRFAGPKALTGSPENSLGLMASIGGQTFLPLFINKGRALEYLLAAKAFDGPTGAALGLFNHYYETAEELDSEVQKLAERAALFPQWSLNETKATLNAFNPSAELLARDLESFTELAGLPLVQENVASAIEASGNETIGEWELGLPDSVVRDLYGRV